MRMIPASFLIVLALSVPGYAASMDSRVPDQRVIDTLEQRASQAQPKERYFLYAQLVHEMVELSAHQYAAGEVDQAKGVLQRVQEFTHRIQTALAGNDKKLKDAQILLRHTAFRLTEMLHSSPSDDRLLMQQTLTQLNAAQTQAMLQVFRK